MTTQPTLTRRGMLALTGSAAVVGLAGCSSASGASNQPAKQYVTLTALGGAKADSKGHMHDTFAPNDPGMALSLLTGIPAELTIYNYDEMPHSIVSPKLDLDVTAPTAKGDGEPSVTTHTFTPKKTGSFQWQCTTPCDKEYNGWAMYNDGYMMGTFDVTAPDGKQTLYTTIQSGLKKGSDGKLHDSYSPAEFTVTKGVPVKMVVQNFDDMPHTFTSSDLNVDQKIDAAEEDGEPTTTTFSFTPSKKGTFTWECALPCDDEANGWAMRHDGYMKGTVTVVD